MVFRKLFYSPIYDLKTSSNGSVSFILHSKIFRWTKIANLSYYRHSLLFCVYIDISLKVSDTITELQTYCIVLFRGLMFPWKYFATEVSCRYLSSAGLGLCSYHVTSSGCGWHARWRMWAHGFMMNPKWEMNWLVGLDKIPHF